MLDTILCHNSTINGETFAQIDFIKCNILSLYEEDLAKYDDENHEKTSVIYRTIPEQLENKNSHFKFSLVDMVAQMLRASGHSLYFHEFLYCPEESEREKIRD